MHQPPGWSLALLLQSLHGQRGFLGLLRAGQGCSWCHPLSSQFMLCRPQSICCYHLRHAGLCACIYQGGSGSMSSPGGPAPPPVPKLGIWDAAVSRKACLPPGSTGHWVIIVPCPHRVWSLSGTPPSSLASAVLLEHCLPYLPQGHLRSQWQCCVKGLK